MKTIISIPPRFKLLALAATTLLASVPLRAINLDFGSSPGAMLSFAGNGTFSFVDSAQGIYSGTDFVINLSSSGRTGSNSAVGLLGNLGGTFTLGAISSGVAAVTGSGPLTITDGANLFAGNVQWLQIHQAATSGNLNLSGVVNVTGITYGGSNQDLMELAAPGSASAVLSFSFASPGYSLTQLASTPVTTSYNGDLHPSRSVPEGGSTLLILGAVLGLAGLALRHGWTVVA
ncbi:MAG: hypothetical protein ACO3G4_06570 [Opitutaceae bacterium]